MPTFRITAAPPRLCACGQKARYVGRRAKRFQSVWEESRWTPSRWSAWSRNWEPYRTREGLATNREIAETGHCLNKSLQSFRLIVVRWKNAPPSLFEAEDYCYHAVASNRKESESASEVLWWHNQRGEAENWHKELKLELGMEQMPCGQQEANAVYFGIGVLAYNLSLMLKAKLLPPEYRHSSVATLRWKLYRLAGKLVRHARVWVLKVRTEGEKLALLQAARQRCYELSLSSA